MIDKDKSLIKQEKNVFKKFAYYFINIFKRIKNRKIKESVEIDFAQKTEENNSAQELKQQNSSLEKANFFKIYNNIKSGNTDIDDLQIDDLLKFNIIIEKEIELKKEKIYSQKETMEKLDEELKTLKKENKLLEQKID